MPGSLQKTPPIGPWSGMTPLEDFVYHKKRQIIEALDEELVVALYQQRHWEQKILSFSPQSAAPAHILQAFNASSLRVREIQLKSRQVRHSY